MSKKRRKKKASLYCLKLESGGYFVKPETAEGRAEWAKWLWPRRKDFKFELFETEEK